MSTTSLPPAGWYQHGTHGHVEWWDGIAWSTQQRETVKVRRPIYWSNIFRFRTLWFLAVGPIVGGALIFALIPAIPPTVIWFVLFVGLAWSSMTSQMACHHCRTILRVTRIGGQQDTCQKCGQLTDKGIAQAQL